jgi:hypothetical protein
MIANVVSGLALPRFQSAGMDNFWVLGAGGIGPSLLRSVIRRS